MAGKAEGMVTLTGIEQYGADVNPSATTLRLDHEVEAKDSAWEPGKVLKLWWS
ncbi:hypothetical protein [Arthrobacter sp. ISL-28]|uniref:hypothetical protein n=1 Tax=Arthrobacter sp. ISL-28 TaxID=2819108 RepID=UPI001BECECF6|nr:hypothetical protein [Arthrobacter sp. ISL-28]MBT2521387.1 hypothetical protein [Arthrobacter sp. ISL-28]